MSVAVQATLEGMPEPSDLRQSVHDGRTVLTVGNRVLADYDSGDVGMRNIAVVTLTELGFAGQRVAEVVGLTPQYISMLRARARREGSAGLVRTRGRRPKLSVADVRRARAWRAQGLSDVEIGRRLGVSDKTSLSEFPCKQRMTDTVILSQRKPPWEEDSQSVQGHCPAHRSRPGLASSLT